MVTEKVLEIHKMFQWSFRMVYWFVGDWNGILVVYEETLRELLKVYGFFWSLVDLCGHEEVLVNFDPSHL